MKRKKRPAKNVAKLRVGSFIFFGPVMEPCPVDKEWLSVNTTPLPFPFLAPEPDQN